LNLSKIMPRRLIQFIFILIALLFATSVKAGTIIRPVHNFGLVGYWDFQEGAGTIANDKSGHSNHFILHGNPAWVDGKIGKALYFDNSNTQYGIIADTDQNGLEFNGGNYTVNFWVKFETVGTNQGIFAKYNSGADGYYIGWFWPVDSYHLYANHWENSSNNGEESSFGTSDVEVGPWYMMSVIFNDTTNEIVFCLNAVCDAPDTMEYTSLGNAADVELARVDASDYFNGTLDEFRVYNRALSESEIQRIYKLTQPKMLAPSNNGLVGYWSFEEGTGTNVGDMSGQGNSCTLGAGMVQSDWINGKLGKALEFDGGANDRADCGAAPVNLIEGASEATLSFWAKRSALNNSVSVAARSSPNAFSTSFWYDGKVYMNVSTGSCVSAYASFVQNDTNWHHVVMVFDGNLTGDSEKLKGYVDGVQKSMSFSGSICSALSATLPNLYIGYDSDQNDFSQGMIDEVRIYNRALETSEITALYNSSVMKFNSSQNNQLTDGLVGLWSFNGPDVDGDTAVDRSSGGNNGTIVGATPTIGKVGQALSFNGTSDYVNLGESQWDGSWMNHTITVWIRWEGKGPSTVDYLMGKGSGGPNGFSYDISQGPGGLGTVEFRMNSTPRSATTTIKPNDGNWHFLAVALNSSNIYFYLDGNADGSNTHSYAGDNDWSMLIGGIDTGSPPYSPFKGKIDEVRLYNRALTAQEVQRLYNLGR
jgi:hypothetical protein